MTGSQSGSEASSADALRKATNSGALGGGGGRGGRGGGVGGAGGSGRVVPHTALCMRSISSWMSTSAHALVRKSRPLESAHSTCLHL